MTGSEGTMPPANFTHVGNRSIVPATAPQVVPGLMCPGHQAMVGTRTPPSQVLPLLPRSGPAVVASPTTLTQGPLSLVKITNVLSASLSRRSVSSTTPTLQSTSSTQSPNFPLLLLP